MRHVPIITITKCKGENPDKSYVCAGRDVCYRYIKPATETQDYADFWKAGDACPNSESVPKGISYEQEN